METDEGVNVLSRVLGRIEGKQEQILSELQAVRGEAVALRTDFGDHKNEDQRNFSSTRNLIYAQRDELKAELKTQLEAQDEKREKHLNEQDIKLNALIMARAILKGQLTLGQKVLAAVGAFGAFAWGVFETFFNHHH